MRSLLSQSVLNSGVIKRQVNPAIVLVVNNTGAVLPQFTAIGLGTPACLPTDNLEQFERKALFNAATTASRYGVCQDAIQDGYIGRVVVAGVTPAIGVVQGASVLWTDGITGGYSIVMLGGVMWSGYVQFANLRGVPGRVSATGTPSDFIMVLRDAGTVQFTDGGSVSNWPEGTEIYAIADLPPGDLIIH